MTPATPSAAGAPRATPGDLLLGIVPLAAIAVLLVNDHVLKRSWPGLVTGKLSDGAGLVFFPLLLVGGWQLLGGRGRDRGTGLTAVVVAVAITGVAFALAKATDPGADAYRAALGLVQWPAHALVALASGATVPAPVPVVFVADRSDLVMLPALAVPLAIGIARRAQGWSSLRPRFGLHAEDGPVAALLVAMFAGAVVDGWAHTHLPSALETILSPWHAIVYTAFAVLVGVVVGGAAARRRDGARPVRAAIPMGYGPAVVGIGLFLAAGVADSAWHVAFGIEADVEALVSPTHLLLGLGAGLIASGPVRAAWLGRLPAVWPGFLPAALAVGTATGLLAFATHAAHPLVDPWPVYPYDPGSSTYWATAPLGIASVALQAAILAGGLTLLLRCWRRVPAGALALVVVVASAPLVPLHDQTRLLPVVPVAAVAAEAVRWVVTPRRPGWTSPLVGAVVPSVLWIGEVSILVAAGENRWSAHLLGGALVVAAVVGGLVGLLAILPSSARDQ